MPATVLPLRPDRPPSLDPLIAIAAPGFSADCIETIEELGIRGRETFTEAGGTNFARLDCLNEGEEGMAMLDALLRRELAGWWGVP